MINLNNMMKMSGCIAFCSTLLLAVLGVAIGFLDNTVVDAVQLIMKGCLVGVGIGTIGLITGVIYYECFYAQDACCAHKTQVDTAALLAPVQTLENTEISVNPDFLKAQNELTEDMQSKNRFCCCK